MVSEKTAPIAVIMGSDSNLDVMQHCISQLREFDIDPIVRILSAHRTPDLASQFADSAAQSGIKVIIAAAGMAAHLAGSLAGRTTVPVIGVPLVSGSLGGMDALLSTVQMPPGVPVATMALGKAGAKNAALFALQILALSNTHIQNQLAGFRLKQMQKVVSKNTSVR